MADGPHPHRAGRHPLPPPATADLRDLDVLQRTAGPFDDLAHTADVRPGGRNAGWHHPRRIGFFLWRLRLNRATEAVQARAAAGGSGFHLSPLGHPAPLFNQPRPDTDPAARGDERSVPAPLRHLAIARSPADWYGPVVRVQRLVAGNWQVVPVTDVVLMDLSDWAAPPAGKMGLDVRRGRVRFAGAQPTAVRSEFTWAFSAPMGAGPTTGACPPPRPATRTARTRSAIPTRSACTCACPEPMPRSRPRSDRSAPAPAQ